MNGALSWVCNIIIYLFIYLFIYSAKLWAEKVGRLCLMEEAGSQKQISMPSSLLALSGVFW